MPTRKLNTVDALKRGVGTAQSRPAGGEITQPDYAPVDPPKPKPVRPEKSARITLNMTPELYRELTRWTGTAAETLDVPRVGVQEALRAMVSVIATGQARNAEQMVLAAIRDELNS